MLHELKLGHLIPNTLHELNNTYRGLTLFTIIKFYSKQPAL
jgi:hypothetical protein